jgi:hypothetical protein
LRSKAELALEIVRTARARGMRFAWEAEKESPFGNRLNDGRRAAQADADVELSRFGG